MSSSSSEDASADARLTQKPPPLFQSSPRDRLSLPFGTRVGVSVFFSTIVGSALGLSHGSKETALCFRAENSHRLPTTTKGWFLYHKTKNYAVMLGGIREARRLGVKLGFWTATFLVLEDVVDAGRDAKAEDWVERQPAKDALSTVCAALTTAGAFSLWNGLPLATAASLARSGLAIGITYGIAQDVLSVLQGRRVGYVDWMRRTSGLSGRGDGKSSI